jgi:hypothetical protein
MKLAPIADRVAKRRADDRDKPGWEEQLWFDIDWAGRCELDCKQMDIVFDMVVARWNKAKKAADEWTDQCHAADRAKERSE